MENTSRLIKFISLNNTRDLGGIKTRYGLIKSRCLLRSGMLSSACENDLLLLEEMGLRKVYDFRTSGEKAERPNPDIKNALYIHLPVINEVTSGITWDDRSVKETMKKIFEMAAENPDYGKHYMANLYVNLVKDDHSVKQYSLFLKDLIENEGCSLWHCTAGKDRTGIAAMFVLELLGASRHDIIADYTDTNRYTGVYPNSIAVNMEGVNDNELIKRVVRDITLVYPEYLLAAYDYIENEYGSITQYFNERMGIGKDEISSFRKMYLE
ncbi:MAG: tyrosine-protein phosphatase [Eubacteriales bacterium]|jgi:protein-tyrosine phosphatase